MFQMMDHGLYNDDGVVHHNSDRKHESEHGQRVDGEPEHREKDERADKGNRDRDQRDDRCTDVLKEDKNNDGYEYKSFDERLYDLVNRSFDSRSGIVYDLVVHIGGKYGLLML